MQDLLVITVAVGTAAWLLRRSLRRLLAPGCAVSDSHPSGGGSFVPLDQLMATAARPPRQEPR